MKVVGIDIGTTSVCGVLIDATTGCVEKSVTKNSSAFIEGCADWEKIQSVNKIMTVATDILESLIAASSEVGVIGVTGQMHGIVYTDKDGDAVSPLYTWQDGRGNLPYKDVTYAKYLNSFSGYGNVTDFYNTENGIKPESAQFTIILLCSSAGLKSRLFTQVMRQVSVAMIWRTTDLTMPAQQRLREIIALRASTREYP